MTQEIGDCMKPYAASYCTKCGVCLKEDAETEKLDALIDEHRETMFTHYGI